MGKVEGKQMNNSNGIHWKSSSNRYFFPHKPAVSGMRIIGPLSRLGSELQPGDLAIKKRLIQIGREVYRERSNEENKKLWEHPEMASCMWANYFQW